MMLRFTCSSVIGLLFIFSIVETSHGEATCTTVRSRAKKLMAAIDELCNSTASDVQSPEPSYYSPYNWTSVPMTSIGSSNLQHAATFSYNIPDVIPSTAREVLVHAGFYTGHSNNGPLQYLKIYTQIETNRYEKYLMVFSYPQSAVNTNSDNMWFPMPPNRLVYLTVPTETGNNSGVRLYVIGYR